MISSESEASNTIDACATHDTLTASCRVTCRELVGLCIAAVYWLCRSDFGGEFPLVSPPHGLLAY